MSVIDIESEGKPAMTEKVLVDVRDGVGIITMNRPEARNAIDLELSRGIAAAVDDLLERDDVGALVLTGAGLLFSAGMDLKAFARGERPSIPSRGLGGITQVRLRKPLIAAVEGYALAGGLELALAADIIVAAKTAVFGLPEVSRGLVAAGGGLLRIAKVLPYGRAMQFTLSGDRMDAERAHEAGLVATLCEPGQALDEAVALAVRIANNAPMAVQLTKEILSGAVGWVDEEQHLWQRAIAEPAFGSEDAKEGARSFAERRPPVWTGR